MDVYKLSELTPTCVGYDVNHIVFQPKSATPDNPKERREAYLMVEITEDCIRKLFISEKSLTKIIDFLRGIAKCETPEVTVFLSQFGMPEVFKMKTNAEHYSKLADFAEKELANLKESELMSDEVKLPDVMPVPVNVASVFQCLCMNSFMYVQSPFCNDAKWNAFRKPHSFILIS